ncbi:MAG: hypothetical protein ABI626_08850 [Sphingomicrobium sp.]
MTKKNMTLYAQADDEAGKLVWAIGETPPTKKGHKKTITFPPGSQYDVTILLSDNTSPKRGIAFNPATPLYVQEGGSCPPQPALGSSEIPSTSVNVPNTNTLKFTNLNMKECILIYQLNFVDSKGRTVDPPLDPEFKNTGGGGRKLTRAAAVTAAAIGALLIYLVLTSMGKLGQ